MAVYVIAIAGATPSRRPRSLRSKQRWATLGSLALVAACANATAPSPPSGAVDPCLLEASLDGTPDTTPLTIALGEPVRPPAPARAPNRSETIVFRHLYEPLVRLDCTGRPQPALAAAWLREGDGATWRLTLRAGARFTDGQAATAASVASGITASGGAVGLEALGLASVRADGALDVVFTFRAPHPELPLALADPDWAPLAQGSDPWPAGTGPYRLVSDGGAGRDPTAQTSARWPVILAVPVSGRGRAIVFRGGEGADLRDALHDGADILVAEDPEVRAYAATLTEFVVAPLPWDRVYVLALPASLHESAPPIPDDVREGLARDAVRGDARAASGTYWWEARGDCPDTAAPAPKHVAASSPPRIVFRNDDPVARSLSERLVAVATAEGNARLAGAEAVRTLIGSRTAVVHGVSDPPFDDTLRSGTDAAYIVSLSRLVYDRCRAVLALRRSMPWLGGANARLVPLVETRAYVVMRRGASRLRVEWDGVPVVSAQP